MTLTFPYHLYEELKPTLQSQLTSYQRVPPSRWFREVVFCLLTPQSSPFHAELALQEIEKHGGLEFGLSEKQVAEILGAGHRYVRFHNQKAKRIFQILAIRPLIEILLMRNLPPEHERAELMSLIKGMGLKESSHALRNIGRRGLCILDRHILRCLETYGALKKTPKTLSEKSYFDIETSFHKFARKVGADVDELDLFFWFLGAGMIFK